MTLSFPGSQKTEISRFREECMLQLHLLRKKYGILEPRAFIKV